MADGRAEVATPPAGTAPAAGPAPGPTAGAGPNVVSMPSLELPTGGGAIRGMGETFDANAFTGTGTVTIPLPISQGRAKFGPALALGYDSGAGNGPFGFGWSLSTPAISRRTEKGLPRYDDDHDSDVFVLAGAEDLVPTEELRVEGHRVRRYRPRIERAYARIERWTSIEDPADVHWRSLSRDNVLTVFGASADSRVADPFDRRRIFSWLVCESRDPVGNAIRYEYKADDAAGVDLGAAHERNRGGAADPRRRVNRYLKRIRYGNRTPLLGPDGNRPRFIAPDVPAGTDWLFEVVFDYGEHDQAAPTPREDRAWSCRRDQFSSYRPGFEVRTTRLCRRVLMFHHFPDEPGVGADCLVSSVELQHRSDGGPAGYAMLRSATQRGFRRSEQGYLEASLPPLEFGYTGSELGDTVEVAAPEVQRDLPSGLTADPYRWTDLHGDGVSGVLSEQGGSWFYLRNLSPAGHHLRFAPITGLGSRPNVSLETAPAGAQATLTDLAGDGQVDLVVLDGPMPGVYRHDDAEGWEPFRPFSHVVTRRIAGPQAHLVDLDGDGRADLLLDEQDDLVWLRSLGDDGFGEEHRSFWCGDEERGPRLVVDNAREALYLADLSGDGLADLVRVRNGDVCYWPNLGFGRFGAKVTMDDAPLFDQADRFDPARLRVADIDGSGTADLIYLHPDGARLYLNRSGNSWAPPLTVPMFASPDQLASVAVLDLLGDGTACLVWSSPVPADAGCSLRYLRLLRGKPHLLVRMANNLGAESVAHYVPSTRFAVQDRLAGRPWLTKLPFPVHVIDRVETRDRITGNRFVTRRAYHDGYYDGQEREFRGFGVVEQWDTEHFGPHVRTGPADEFRAPPVLTRTWFHTGAPADRRPAVERPAELGGYYREPGWDDEQARAHRLPEPALPPGLSADERREAHRSLKGAMLRREVYGLDGSAAQCHPYTVTEQSVRVICLRRKGNGRYGVFVAVPDQTLTRHYERVPEDPRIEHRLILELDEFSNALRQADIGYGRRNPDPSLPADADRMRQARPLITYTRNGFTNAIDLVDHHRTPATARVRIAELTGFRPTGPAGRFRAADFEVAAIAAATEVDHEASPGPGPSLRLIGSSFVRLRPDDLGVAAGDPLALLEIGVQEPKALAGQSYRLAYPAGLAMRLFRRDGTALLDDATLAAGGYLAIEGGWWCPAGRVFLSPRRADGAEQELAYARTHFFLPCRFRDPFDRPEASTEAIVTYDRYDLLVDRTTDALGNTIIVGQYESAQYESARYESAQAEPAPAEPAPDEPAEGGRVRSGNDYRTLKPTLLTDPNGNRSQVVLDAMGEVVATVRMGKVTEQLGDSAQGCVPDLDPITVRRILADPLGAAAGVLGSAGTRTVYDRFAFLRGDGPAGCLTIARQTHLHELGAGEQTRVQCELTYSDGFGRVVQKKLQAEPDADRGERWIGSGWTVFDDKARPIRRFEPFFTSTPAFENERRAGVSALLCYDPVGRVVTTLHPDGTFEKVIIGPWEQTTWDAQDTVLLDPRTDPDVCGYLAGWLGTQPAWRTWYDQRVHGERGRFDQQAAAKASRHAATPGRSVLDPLGRELVAIAHNGWAGQRPVLFTTRGERDVEGNLRVLRDAAEHPDPAGRVCLRVDYDLVGQRVREVSGDAGERWILPDCLGNPLRVWDGRGLDVRNDYDRLRRPVAVYVTGADPDRPGAVVLTERLTYGEELPDAAERNLRHRLYRQRDQAGVLCTESVDFKGNVTASSRALAAGYADIVDWSGAPALEPERWLTTTEYDAFDRPVLVTAPGLPDRPGSVLRYSFNDSQLLCRVEAQLAGRPEDDGSWTTLVSSISYDARSQRTAVHHGNGTVTRYRYDPLTFRTVRLCTRRGSGYVQDLRYTYDAIANITHIEDRAQDPVFFRNQRVDPSADYTYDAVYRLVRATGRELVGHADHPDHPTGPHNTPADAKAVARYEQCYVYDPVGNLLELTHRSRDRHHGGWTRRFEVGPDSNRLTGTSVGDGPAEHLESDANGNTVRMPHLHLLSWDYRNRLRAVQRQRADGPAERTFYSYDAGGARVRKVTRRGGTVREERIYLGGLEIYRRHSGKRAGLVRESLHVMDARQRVAIIETRGEVDDGTLPRVVRYQYADHLASVALELDERARTITYEEFTPYGSSAYRAARRRLHPPKRYRFCGQERDDESGFNYHGARYLAPWLGRWISPDPQGLVDGPNRFAYARGNPVGFVDPSGTDCDPSQQCCVDDSLTTPREDAAQACLADPGEPVLFSAAAPNSSSMSSSPAGSTTQDSALSGYSVASLGVNVTAAGIRYAYLPRDAAGNPLQGPLNLYSGATARASAQAADGYMIKDTVYYAPADAAENALRARLGIPTGNLPVDEYNAIWGEASRLAVRDAAISSSVGTHNDLATLDPDSIQAIYELPTNRSYGSGMGGLNVVGGGLSIWGAAHDDTSWRSTLGYTGGGMQVAGGGMMIVGALETAPRLVSGGRLLGTAGAVITAPIVLSQAYDDVTSGDQYRQLNGTLKGAGVVFPPAAFLSVYNDAFVKPAAETFYDVACRDIADMLGVPRSWVY